MWYRVFSRNDVLVKPAALQQHVRSIGLGAELHFKGDDLGWTSCRIVAGGALCIDIERYRSDADDVRDELNTWAAWLETQSHEPNHPALMERVIAARQVFTIEPACDSANNLGLDVAKYLAAETDGMIQIDAQGILAADGSLLLQEK